MSHLWTVPRPDFWPHSCQPMAKPENTSGSPKTLRPGGPETPFPALSDKYFCQKGSVKWLSFHAWYLPLVLNAWEVSKGKRPCTNAIQPKTLSNTFLFADNLVQNLTLPQIQVSLVTLPSYLTKVLLFPSGTFWIIIIIYNIIFCRPLLSRSVIGNLSNLAVGRRRREINS